MAMRGTNGAEDASKTWRLQASDLVWLACPVCRMKLEVYDTEGVRCTGCRRVFPIVDGLLVLLADRATLTSESD